MNVHYVDPKKTYLITNHAVASNDLFKDGYYCKRFLQKVEKYLSPLADILAHSLDDDQFQLVVKLKDRASFIEYYVKKKTMKGQDVDKIPASTYIFSQAMANLQASMAIHLNRKEGRSGALFARRFAKVLIEGKVELDRWLDRLSRMVKIHRYYGKWKSKGVRRVWGYEKLWYRQKRWLGSGQFQGQLKNELNLAANSPNPNHNQPKKPPS